MSDLLSETHGLVREIKGKIEGIESATLNGKKQRRELYGRVGTLERDTVKKPECEKMHAELRKTIPEIVEHSVIKAMNGRSRSRWLVIKDILLITLAPLFTAIMGYMFWSLTKGQFTP